MYPYKKKHFSIKLSQIEQIKYSKVTKDTPQCICCKKCRNLEGTIASYSSSSGWQYRIILSTSIKLKLSIDPDSQQPTSPPPKQHSFLYNRIFYRMSIKFVVEDLTQTKHSSSACMRLFRFTMTIMVGIQHCSKMVCFWVTTFRFKHKPIITLCGVFIGSHKHTHTLSFY